MRSSAVNASISQRRHVVKIDDDVAAVVERVERGSFELVASNVAAQEAKPFDLKGAR